MTVRSIVELKKQIAGAKVIRFAFDLEDSRYYTGFGQGVRPSKMFILDDDRVVYLQDKVVYLEHFRYVEKVGREGRWRSNEISRFNAKISCIRYACDRFVDPDEVIDLFEPYFAEVEVEDGIYAVEGFERLVTSNMNRQSGYSYPHTSRRFDRTIVLAWWLRVEGGDVVEYHTLNKDKTWSQCCWITMNMLRDMIRSEGCSKIDESVIAKTALIAA